MPVAQSVTLNAASPMTLTWSPNVPTIAFGTTTLTPTPPVFSMNVAQPTISQPAVVTATPTPPIFLMRVAPPAYVGPPRLVPPSRGVVLYSHVEIGEVY